MVPDVRLVEDCEHAPDPRQEEIQRFLISTALDEQQPDLVRQNAFTALQMLSAYTRNAVKISVAAHFQEKVGRRPLVQLEARVANAAGVFPYIRRAQRTQFFESFYEQMKRIGHEWRAHAAHGELLSTLSEAGGLSAIPEGPRKKMVKWLVLAYMGEPGGYGTMGQNRRVFYSNTAAPLVEELLHTSRETIREDVRALQDDRDIRRASSDEHVARRYHQLLNLVEE